MKAVICGANGAMGKLICGILGDEAVGKVSIDGENGVPKTFDELGTVEADVVVDFSHHSAISGVLDYAKKIGAAAVIGTTGHSEEEKALIYAAAKEIPVFFSGNMSMGIAVLCRLAKEAAKYFPDADIEIVEAHHNRKVDAPSGTALALADSLNEAMDNQYHYTYDRSQRRQMRDDKEIGISAVRGGTIVGEHEVIFAGPDEVIEFKHTAYSKAVFGKGAVEAAKFLAGKPAGRYEMSDVISAK